MKINWNSKYNTIAVYAFMVICAVIIFYLSLSQLSEVQEKVSYVLLVLQPFTIGIIIAYILDFILKFFEEKVLSFKKMSKLKSKTRRTLGLILTYITAFLLLRLFIQFVLPQLIDSIVGLLNDVPSYISNSNKLINGLIDKLNLSDKNVALINEKLNEMVDYIINLARELLPLLGNVVKSIASSIWNIVLGISISIYLLADKEKFIAIGRKIIWAIFPEKGADKILEIAHRSNLMFGKFLSGKILDSFIIGVLMFIILNIAKIPYALLVSVIVGITNVIPFFGPFIGAIPSFIIILFVNPIKALWFLIIVLIVQQVDGNIIGPKILGDSVGLSAFWILFAILVAGEFLGLVGMVIGVPLFAIFYSLVKEFIENKLKKKGLKTDTKDYY